MNTNRIELKKNNKQGTGMKENKKLHVTKPYRFLSFEPFEPAIHGVRYALVALKCVSNGRKIHLNVLFTKIECLYNVIEYATHYRLNFQTNKVFARLIITRHITRYKRAYKVKPTPNGGEENKKIPPINRNIWYELTNISSKWVVLISSVWRVRWRLHDSHSPFVCLFVYHHFKIHNVAWFMLIYVDLFTQSLNNNSAFITLRWFFWYGSIKSTPSYLLWLRKPFVGN